MWPCKYHVRNLQIKCKFMRSSVDFQDTQIAGLKSIGSFMPLILFKSIHLVNESEIIESIHNSYPWC